MTKKLELAERGDAELARAVAAAVPGEARAEEAELCRRFAPRVRLYGLRHLRAEESAADLVQRTLLLTIEKLRVGAVREPERIASFVLGVARHTAREMRRDRREEPLEPELDHLEAPLDWKPQPLAGDRLVECIEQLAERERTVLLLSFYQEQSAGEIGAALSLKEGNVRVIRHRAIDRLRGCMGEEGAR